MLQVRDFEKPQYFRHLDGNISRQSTVVVGFTGEHTVITLTELSRQTTVTAVSLQYAAWKLDSATKSLAMLMCPPNPKPGRTVCARPTVIQFHNKVMHFQYDKQLGPEDS